MRVTGVNSKQREVRDERQRTESEEGRAVGVFECVLKVGVDWLFYLN